MMGDLKDSSFMTWTLIGGNSIGLDTQNDNDLSYLLYTYVSNTILSNL